MPPASAWTFTEGCPPKKGAYFQPEEWEQQEILDPGRYYEKLRETFVSNLPRYFQGPEKIGMSLTGGLDTRMIMAWQNCPPDSLPCYSFGGMFRDCQDVILARRVAQAVGQPHEVIPVGEHFLKQFPANAERSVYLTDGCVQVNHSADLYANEIAAQIAPVRLTGNYGGEVLRRVRAFKPSDPFPGLFAPEVLGQVQVAKATYQNLLDTHPLSFAVFRQAPWHHYSLLSLEQTQVSLRSPFLDNDFVKTVYQAPESSCANSDVSRRLIADGNPRLLGIRTDRQYLQGEDRWTARLLHWTMDFTAKAEYAYDYGMPQWVARIDHTLSPLHLERLFLGRHKFCHYRVWYRDALSNYVRDMLLDSRTTSRPYLEKGQVEAIVRGHLKGDHNYTTEIHKLLTLELTSRLFLDA